MIEIVVYIVTLVAVIIGIGYFVFTMSSGEKQLESTLTELDAKNAKTQESIKRVHHKFTHDMGKAQHVVNKMNSDITVLQKKIELIVTDYETKFSDIQNGIRSTRDSLAERIKQAESVLNKTTSEVKTSLQANNDSLAEIQTKASALQKQLIDNENIFKEFKETVNAKLGSFAELRKRIISIETNVRTMKGDVQKIQSSLSTIITRLGDIGKLAEKVTAIEAKTGGVTKDGYESILKTVNEYKDVMPRLKTLPQDYVTKASLQALEEEYKKDMPELQAQLMLLKTRVSTGSEADAQINSTMTELQALVAQLKSDISESTTLLSDVGKVRALAEQIGDVNIAQYKEQIELLPKLGSLIAQVGSANISQYKDQLPLLVKVTDLLNQVGDTNISAYKDHLTYLTQIPDLNTKVTNLQANIKTVEQDIPNLSKTLSAIETVVKELQAKVGPTGEIQTLQKVIDDYKSALGTSNNNLVAKNAICIQDICLTKDQLLRLVRGRTPPPINPIIPGSTQAPSFHFEALSARRDGSSSSYLQWSESSNRARLRVKGTVSSSGFPHVQVTRAGSTSVNLNSSSGYVITAVVNTSNISQNTSLISLFNYSNRRIANEISLTSALSKPYDNFGAVIRSYRTGSTVHRVANQFPHRLNNRWNVISVMVTPEGRYGSSIRLFINGAHTFNITNVYNFQNVYHQNVTYTPVPFASQYTTLQLNSGMYRDVLVHSRALTSSNIASLHRFFLTKYRDISLFGSPFIPQPLLGSVPGVFLYDSKGNRYPFIGPRLYTGNDLNNVNWNNRAVGIWVKINTQVACWSGNNRSGTKAMFIGMDYPGNYYVLPSVLQQRISSLEIQSIGISFGRYN